MPTLADLIARHGIDILGHLDREVAVPVLAGLQLQGDIAVIPTSAGARARSGPGSVLARAGRAAGVEVPPEGLTVVLGELGGSSHQLLAEGGGVRWTPATADDPDPLALGRLSVPVGASAYLAHPEHAYTGIAPGEYLLRRQREHAGRPRRVSD